MRLPNAERAVIRIEKLTDYSLNPWHEGGKHKARVFRSALGVTIDDADWLREEILELVLETDARPGRTSGFGQKYIVDILIEHGEQKATVRTTWMIDSSADFPHLTSCYVI